MKSWCSSCLLFVTVACAPRYQVLTFPPCQHLVLHEVSIGDPSDSEAIPPVSGYPGGRIILYVSDLAGRAVRNVIADLRSPSFSQGYFAEPQTDGVYLFCNVPAVDVQIRLSAGVCVERVQSEFSIRVSPNRITPVFVVLQPDSAAPTVPPPNSRLQPTWPAAFPSRECVTISRRGPRS